jgi:hypothetical protein
MLRTTNDIIRTLLAQSNLPHVHAGTIPSATRGTEAKVR